MEELRAEFPRLRIIAKRDDLLQRSIDAALRLLTLGGQRGYLRRYTTTIGESIYLPRRWRRFSPARRIEVLRHERVHLRQFRRLGLWPMALLYLLVPLPLGLSWFRMRLEREAYEESLAARLELRGVARLRSRRYRRRIVGEFTGPAYGWMWPFPRAVERWFDETVARLVSGGGLR